MSNTLWNRLLVVLQDILTLYQTLLGLSEKKRRVLIAAQRKELEQIVKQEEILILQAAQLERARQNIMQELVQTLAISETVETMATLLRSAPPDIAGGLNVATEQLKALMGQLQTLNTINTELIQQALGFVQYNINVLSQVSVGPSYVPEGEREQAEARTKRLFDAKV